MTGWTVAADYSPGIPNEKRWVKQTIKLTPPPAGSAYFRVVLMLRLLNGPAEGAFYDEIRVRKRVPDTKTACTSCSTAPSFGGVGGAAASCSMVELNWS